MPLILLKGVAYALAAGARPAILGHRYPGTEERLDEVEAVLMMYGWACNHNDAYDQRYYDIHRLLRTLGCDLAVWAAGPRADSTWSDRYGTPCGTPPTC